MSNRELIDPFFNNPELDKKMVTSSTTISNQLVAAAESPPLSISSRQPMTLVKGAYGDREFSMWVDLSNRLTIPVREDVK